MMPEMRPRLRAPKDYSSPRTVRPSGSDAGYNLLPTFAIQNYNIENLSYPPKLSAGYRKVQYGLSTRDVLSTSVFIVS